MAAFRPGWARSQRAQELAPEGFGLTLLDVEADHLAAAGLVHRVGDHEALLLHPAGLSDPLGLGVEPQVGVAALGRALAEGVRLFVEAAAHARGLIP
jgi:hypothetical protein